MCCETHAREAQALRSGLGWQKLVSIVESDGYAALKAAVAAAARTGGLVLIDPPFETDNEFDRILAALENRL